MNSQSTQPGNLPTNETHCRHILKSLYSTVQGQFICESQPEQLHGHRQ